LGPEKQVQTMKQATQEFIDQYLKPDEGELHQIYGKVKNGKTLFATMLAWKDLMRGQSVLANWQIHWEGLLQVYVTWQVLEMLRLLICWLNCPMVDDVL